MGHSQEIYWKWVFSQVGPSRSADLSGYEFWLYFFGVGSFPTKSTEPRLHV